MSRNSGRKLFIAPPVYSESGIQVIRRVLIANRGEIACRIIDSCRKLGIVSVAVFTDAESQALHVKRASESFYLGPAEHQPYQNIELLLEVAKQLKVDAIHPGYGYLSENAGFARAVNAAGIIFIGPTPESITALGDKREAKAYLREKSNVPLIPGYNGLNQDVGFLKIKADEIGYPVMIKASSGGGGKGMRIVRSSSEFEEAFTRCVSEAERSFGSGHCLIEKYIEAGKHVEIQIFGDGDSALSLWDRECSVQRRHQKVVEESPCSWMGKAMRKRMSDTAIEIAYLLQYKSAGTVEFILDITNDAFYFLEVNTRIQVEHPITEEVTGVDIVALQFYVAAGGALSSLAELQEIRQEGHAIEVRLCAEDPFNGFLPCTGKIGLFKTASEVLRFDLPNVRYESGVESGSSISVYFDSMVSKIVVWAQDRNTAIRKLQDVLKNTICLGVTTNQHFLGRILSHPAFQISNYTTSFIDIHKEELFSPKDSSAFLSSAAIVAKLCYQEAERSCNEPLSYAFRSIPSRFRNQHKDETSPLLTYLTCDLKPLGHPEALSVMVSEVGSQCYRTWQVPEPTPPTVAEKEAFFNRLGGTLVKRYYEALRADPGGELRRARVIEWHWQKGQNSWCGDLQVFIDGSIFRYFAVIQELEGFQKQVFLHCPEENVSVSYAASNKLTWAGKLSERAKGQLGSDAKKQCVSPMPGKILQVLCKDGAIVHAGDGLLVLESMKTELRMNSPASGIVKVNVKEGDIVNEGVVLCDIMKSESD